MKKPLVILGASSLAKDFYWYICDMGDRGINVCDDIIFVDDTLEEEHILGIGGRTFKIQNHWNFDQPYEFIISIGNPIVKKIMVEKALAAGLIPADTIIHPDAKIYGKDNKIGKGGFIAPGCILTTNIRIGDYVIVNVDCTIGHDSTLEDYVTCNPGCHVSGFVTIKKQTVLGTGTVIRDRISVEEKNIIGAQSAVVKNIDESDGIYGGVPCKKIKDRI